jgi:hypothetical protein
MPQLNYSRLQNVQIVGEVSSAAVAARGERLSKDRGLKQVKLDPAATAFAALSLATSEYDAARAMMGKLKAKSLSDLCRLKKTAPAIRQLMHAVCAALGECSQQCIVF